MNKLFPSISILRSAAYAIAVIVVSLGSFDAKARMYQWSNQASGTIQLSGTPPAWYRSLSSGPRVFVFENGQLIDDTAVTVPEAQRQMLRENAFGELDQAPEELADVRHDQLRDALEDAAREGVDVAAVTEAFAEEQARAAAQSNTEGSVEQTVAELKALLDAWDSRRVDQAKALLQQPNGNP